MIERTRKKLREAAFFLSHLQREVGVSTPASPVETIEFYLSAFLSAARSVTTVLQSEAPAVYPAWSPGWRASLTVPERELLAEFTDARNRALKRETPVLSEEWRPLQPGLHRLPRIPAELVFFFGEEAAAPSEGRVVVGRLTPEAARGEVLPLCNQYFDILSRLVSTFEQAHG